MHKSEWFSLGLVLIAFATGAAFYPYLPEQVASHWNAAGAANGTLPRAWGAFLFPAIIAVILLVLLVIPRTDPKKENIAKFRKYYDFFLAVFGIAFYYIYCLTLLWNVGYRFDFVVFIVPAIAAIFYTAGVLLPHTELNYTIGIRTPWTLASETVWRKTHQAGGVVFKICAVIALLGVALPGGGAAIWFLIAPIIVAAIGLVVYSYVLWKQSSRAAGN